MIFYELNSPNYGPGANYIRHNPVRMRMSDMPHLPYIYCPVCGAWCGNKRILMPELPEGCAEYFNEPEPLRVDAWNAEKPKWAEMLGVPEDLLEPGSRLGPPLGMLLKDVQLSNLIHPPTVGIVWISQAARDAFVEAGLTGANFVKIDMEDKKGNALPHVNYYEVDIYGQAERLGFVEADTIDCDTCGVRKFPNSQDLRINLSKWDGSDFFNLDGLHHIIMVTSRVKAVCDKYEFGNVIFVPTDQQGPDSDKKVLLLE